MSYRLFGDLMHAEPAMFLTPETIERLHLIQSGLDAFEAAVPKTYISALDFVGEDTVVPDDILRGVISLAGHGEIVTNPILNGSKALLTKMQHEFRKSFILAADEEMRKGLQEGKHERLPNSQRDHILREAQKFKRLAQRYAMLLKEPRPGTSRSRGGDDDDDDDGRVGLEVHRVLMARSGTFRDGGHNDADVEVEDATASETSLEDNSDSEENFGLVVGDIVPSVSMAFGSQAAVSKPANPVLRTSLAASQHRRHASDTMPTERLERLGHKALGGEEGTGGWSTEMS